MQFSFFDQENRLAQLEKLGDPLRRLESIVDWNDFKPLLKKIHQKKRKSNADRKPYDTILRKPFSSLHACMAEPVRVSPPEAVIYLSLITSYLSGLRLSIYTWIS